MSDDGTFFDEQLAGTKRTFVQIMAFPQGRSIADRMGFPGVSNEVHEHEMAIAHAHLLAMTNTVEIETMVAFASKWGAQVVTEAELSLEDGDGVEFALRRYAHTFLALIGAFGYKLVKIEPLEPDDEETP